MLVLPLGLYLLAATAAGILDNRPLSEVFCFEPARVAGMTIWRTAIALLMAAAAACFLFVVPGLLGTLAFMRWPRTRATAHAWSLIANSVALILLYLLLRHTIDVDRLSLAVAWLAWSSLLFVAAWRWGRFWAVLAELTRRYGPGLAVGALAIAAAIVVFFPEQFLQCFNEDGIETFELARSLRGHFLPYWEMETWQPLPGGLMGTVVVNPSLVNSYWTGALQVLLGENELAARLPYWIWWMASLAVMYRLVRPGGGSWPLAVPLALTAFLIGLLFTFYVGYNPYMADLANPGVPNALLTLSLLLGFDCLRQKDSPGWLLVLALGWLVLYAGAVILVLTLVAIWIWRPIERRAALGWGLCGLGALAATVAFYVVFGWFDGSLSHWVDTADIEYLNDYLADVSRWKSGPLFLAFFLVGSGGVAAAGLVWAFRCGAWEKTVATVALLYLLIVLGSGFKNLHYLGPLLPVPIVLFLIAARGTSAGRRTTGWPYWLATVSLLASIWICWPAGRQTFTLNRQLGHNTTIAADSYIEAVQLARLRYTIRRQGLISWDCDQHTWTAYAVLDPELKSPRALLLTTGDPPAEEYRLLASRPMEGTDRVANLYVRDPQWIDWLAGQRPLRPLHRYPAVFRLLADGPYSPHNNELEDVQRLRWPW